MLEPDLYKLSAYQYQLPEELIAQYPCDPRDSSRLLIVERSTGKITEKPFRVIEEMVHAGDSLVFNDTRVIPARLVGKKKSGGRAEVFLVRRHADASWDALVRPGKKLQPGATIVFSPAFSCEIAEVLANGERRIRFHCQGDLDNMLEQCGKIPLPHYIRREPSQEDAVRYQTIYAVHPGALAAPTAGLHFTDEMLNTLQHKGVSQIKITLHVGLGTFRPVKTEDIRTHDMHSERYFITPEAAGQLNRSHKSEGRQICVGTTCCRALEAASTAQGIIEAGAYDTNIFIYPGYQFKYVNCLLTNFHLPGSTLLMLVSAFAGHELIMEAYARAVRDKFRFFSYGDAMLII